MTRTNKKQNKVTTIAAGLVFQMLVLSPAGYADNTFNGFKVRQEKIKSQGVLVSRPVKVDEQIVNFMYNNKISSLEAYAAWVGNNVVYHKEKRTERWQNPIEFLKKRAGDCEDFALLNTSVLSVLGFKPQFFAFVNRNKGHAICVFEWNGTYYYFDNARLMKTNKSNLKEFIQGYVDAFAYSEVREYVPGARTWNTVYVKA